MTGERSTDAEALIVRWAVNATATWKYGTMSSLMEVENDGNGNYEELDNKNIDTGMGSERLCRSQEVNSIFDVDTIKAILAGSGELGRRDLWR